MIEVRGFSPEQTIEAFDLINLVNRQERVAILQEFDHIFQQLPGYELLYGITFQGLLAAVRAGCIQNPFQIGYFRAWAFDTALNPEHLRQEVIETSFSHYSIERTENGSIRFPSIKVRQKLEPDILLSDEALRQKFPDDPGMLNYLRFFKKTGGFYAPPSFSSASRPLIGQHLALELFIS